MRAYIDTVAKALSGRRRPEQQVPRHLRPRLTRSTFVPVRDESVLRGMAHVG